MSAGVRVTLTTLASGIHSPTRLHSLALGHLIGLDCSENSVHRGTGSR
jgi:hypothetical protein